MVRSIKIYACRNETKTCRPMKTAGAKKNVNLRNTRVTCSPANMLAKRRMVSESGRARWLTSSMGIMRGARRGMGPAKCARYCTMPLVKQRNEASVHWLRRKQQQTHQYEPGS